MAGDDSSEVPRRDDGRILSCLDCGGTLSSSSGDDELVSPAEEKGKPGSVSWLLRERENEYLGRRKEGEEKTKLTRRREFLWRSKIQTNQLFPLSTAPSQEDW